MDTFDLAPDPGDAKETDGVMNPRLLPGFPPSYHDGDTGVVPPPGALVPAEDPATPSWADRAGAAGAVGVDHTPTQMEGLLDEITTHIYRARLLIRTCCAGARPALVDELDHVSEDLDAAISQLRTVTVEQRDIYTLTELPALPFIHWAWSEQERRWVTMTFHENQAWLARPDLDPLEFASHQVTL